MEGRVMLHHFKVQGSKKINTTQGATRMTAIRAMYHSDNIPSYLYGNGLKFWHKEKVLIKLFVSFPLKVRICAAKVQSFSIQKPT
jgi:hypothetical protein